MGAIIPLPGCDNAQACYWYQQGCTIGCPTCDHVSGRVQVDLCGLGKVSVSIFLLCFLILYCQFKIYLYHVSLSLISQKATINKPEQRTVNRAAEAGSQYDIYKHNPWRAPGSAPVVGTRKNIFWYEKIFA